MEIQEKIRCLRVLRNWSQADLASQLNMSTNGYTKIERGETKATIPRLNQIAGILGTDLQGLLSFGEQGSVFLMADNNGNSTQRVCSTTESALAIQKLQLLVEYQQQLLTQKEREISHLEELLKLLKPQCTDLP
ncbi:MAG: helix-turn-helix transcriptional regulator [Methylococcales bacterium]|nr:helix-turn-helix transcriptional regulator [Methylococcales bacterium]